MRDDQDRLVDGDPDNADLDEAVTALGEVDFSETAAAGGRVERVEAAIAALQKIVDRHRAGGVQVNGRVMLQFVR